MNYAKSLGLAAAVTIAGAAAADAATYYATTATYITPGANLTPARSDTSKALGAPDGEFMSLGLGGSAIFTFGNVFGSPLSTFEITLGNVATYLETVDVYGILGGVETFLGSVDNYSSTSLTFVGIFDSLKLVDTSISPKGEKRDGFDVDALSVSSVPVPAAGLLLVGALGGLAALRRRKAV
ncbi:MAG: VPLPA-CTERM sorting domain-containing protein [Paracoccaceae bacterium]